MVDTEELIRLAKAGDNVAIEELALQFRPFVKGLSRSYFLIGGDSEDVMQEGMLGLFYAIRDFDPTKNVKFRSFAIVCIYRQIFTAIKKACTFKQIPLANYVSIDDNDLDFVDENMLDPLDVLIGKEMSKNCNNLFDKLLSKLEKEVILLYIKGYNYDEIAAILKKPAKSIDNSLQRAKKKLSKVFLQDEGR